MDKFGYIRGCRGPVGPAGKDVFNLYACFFFSGIFLDGTPRQGRLNFE
jgi:hypothetical protein